MLNYDINDIFNEFESVKNKIEISVDEIRLKIQPYLDKIILYGAGSAGIAFLYYLRGIGIYPKYFVDGNPLKHGTIVEGVEVISIQDIEKKVSSEALIIVTINTDGKRYCKSFDEALRLGGHTGVHKSLNDAGYKNIIDYTWFRRCHDLFKNDKYNLPSCSDVNLMYENRSNICDVFNLLADDKSREVFFKIVKFRMIDDSISIPTIQQDNQYFEYNLYKKVENESFVDCGAFNGITLNTFLKNNNNKFNSYYAIEPDVENYNKLLKNVELLDNNIKYKINTYNNSAYDKKTKSINLYELNGPGTFISEIGSFKSNAISIDEILNGKKATMIKMNIEGSEINALYGAENTIREYKPILAVAGYHKTWDLWEIPKLMFKYYNGYKLFLRSYMNHISFVYYAVPKERIIEENEK